MKKTFLVCLNSSLRDDGIVCTICKSMLSSIASDVWRYDILFFCVFRLVFTPSQYYSRWWSGVRFLAILCFKETLHGKPGRNGWKLIRRPVIRNISLHITFNFFFNPHKCTLRPTMSPKLDFFVFFCAHLLNKFIDNGMRAVLVQWFHSTSESRNEPFRISIAMAQCLIKQIPDFFFFYSVTMNVNADQLKASESDANILSREIWHYFKVAQEFSEMEEVSIEYRIPEGYWGCRF